MEEDALCTMILAAAFRVHTRLGPGLLESVYQRVLAYELTKGGLSVEVQKSKFLAKKKKRKTRAEGTVVTGGTLKLVTLASNPRLR
jgi:GxxExxY protein